MKHLSLFVLFLISFHVYSQSFKIKGEAIKTERVAKDGKLEISKINVVNTSDKPIYLEWKTVSNTFPKGWDCSMCQHGACQIGIPKGSVFKKLNPDQEGFIAIHVIPKNIPGKGKVKFKIYNRDNPKQYATLTFIVEAY